VAGKKREKKKENRSCSVRFAYMQDMGVEGRTLKHVEPRSVRVYIFRDMTDSNPTTRKALLGKRGVAANAGSDPKG